MINRMNSGLRRLVISFKKKRFAKSYRDGIKANLAICNTIPLSSAQKKEVLNYFKKLTGKNICLDWHKYFYSRNNFFSVKYIPTDFYVNEIVYRLNNFHMRLAFSDKNLYDTHFPEIHKPQVYLKKINGYYYYSGEPITHNEAVSLCSNISKAIIKPSVESSSGDNVRLFQSTNGISPSNGQNISEVFNEYGNNFLIQEYINQHESLSNLNATSLNTIRTLTYRRDNDIVELYSVIRIGKLGTIVDNQTAGGIAVKINKNGKLDKYGYGFPGSILVEKTDQGTILENYEIPYYKKVVEIAKKMHLMIPYFKLIGWDFSVDEKGEPVFIELNRSPELSQTAVGPAFGEYTDEILSFVKSKTDTRLYSI